MQKTKINIGQQSTLARLLAQENIHVIHGNYRTAWFDPEKRVLALPIWKDRGKAVYDLLTGHEVGHALYTPAIGWHEAVTNVDGAPKAYLNILEDVRIERKIQDKYPGLRLSFKRAYTQLSQEDFFGLSKVDDIISLLLIDRINLKSKLTDNIEIEFSSIEQSFFDRAYLTETFDDVVALAKEIYNYQKSLYTGLKKAEKMPDVMSDGDGMGDSNDYGKPDPNETQEDSLDEKQQASSEVEEKQEESGEEIQGNHKQSADKPDDQPQEESTKPITEASQQKTLDNDEEFLDSITDKAFREMEEQLTASKDLKGAMVYTLNSLTQNDIIIDYKEYYSEWDKYLSNASAYSRESIAFKLEESRPEYLKFKNDTEAAAAYMAKEFELRKAAYQYSRSSIQKTGLINTNKLHAYKYSEDIFLKSAKLANYKNHGMMMFIDFSGSMQDCIGPTIRQMVNLTTFCRMINIPFEVYAFTTRIAKENDDYKDTDYKSYSDCEVIPHQFNLLNLMSSRMSRKEYQKGMNQLWNLSAAWENKFPSQYINPWNHLYSTPLNTCIQYANTLISSFKQKHGIEKMTTMFLTDGESDSFQVRVTGDGDNFRSTERSAYSYRNSYLRVNGETLEVGSINSAKVTELMLKNLKKNTNSTVLGFFISEYRNQAVTKVCSKTSYAKKETYTDQLTKQRAIIENDIFGYDRYFGLCAKYMDVVEDEFGELVEDGASKSKLKTAFAKLTKQKRVNRIFLNAFVDAMA
jgi:hypothetical protein